MRLVKKYKNKIIVGVFVIAALIAAFFRGDYKDYNKSESTQDLVASETIQKSIPDVESIKENDDASVAITEKPVYDEKVPQTESSVSGIENNIINPEQSKPEDNRDEPIVSAVAEDVPTRTDENTVQELTCTLSVRCDTLLNNLSKLDEEKAKIVPKDGVFFAEQTVVFYEGESVFNLLSREMKKNKIHLEFVNTPIYNSAYIEGIGNIYEFDCGELSGWMYKVNNWFPNYGCSRYQLKEGDRVEWVYTCDLGADVNGDYAARNGK